MKTSYKAKLLVLTVIVCLATVILAQSEHTIGYQGNLTNADGDPLNGAYAMEFSLWDAPEGGEMLWIEGQAVVVTQGAFAVNLGGVNPLSPEVYAPGTGESLELYLQIIVEGELVSPRTRISYSPWSAVSSRMRGDLITNPGQLVLSHENPLAGRVEMGLVEGAAFLAMSENDFTDATAVLNPWELYMVLPIPLPKTLDKALDAGAYYRGAGLVLIDTTGDTIMQAVNDEGMSSVARLNNNETGETAALSPGSLKFTLPTPGPKGDGFKAAAEAAYRANSIVLIDTTGDTIMAVTDGGHMEAESLKTFDFAYPPGAVDSYIMTSDPDGNASWQPPPGGSASGWTDDGAVIRLDNDNDDVSIGSADPEAKLYSYSSDDFFVNKSVYGGVSSVDARAVYGESTPADYYGYGAEFIGGYIGMKASVAPTGSNTYYGVQALAIGGSGTTYGIYAEAGGTGTAWAGFFEGDVYINGELSTTKSGYTIDHPKNPKDQTLSHHTVSSSEMKNVYDGVALLDEKGEATVMLPDYMGSLNQDFRYQLTCIGGYAPVYIAEEIADNKFVIGGGKPRMKISWQVTGVRHDAVARATDQSVERPKVTFDRGK